MKCSADLGELRLQAEIVNTSSAQTSKNAPSQLEKQIVISRTPSSVKKPFIPEELELVKDKIKEIKARNKASGTDEHLDSGPRGASRGIEGVHIMPALTSEEVHHVYGLQQETPIQVGLSKTYAEYSFDEKVQHTQRELEHLIGKWKKILNLNLDIAYDELLNSLPYHDAEFEINPIVSHSDSKKREIENYYNLLLDETENNPRDFSKPVEYVKSETRTIDRRSLHNTLTILRPKLMEEIENAEKNVLEELEADNIPVANNINIIIGTCFDLILLGLFIIGTYYFNDHDYVRSMHDVAHDITNDPLKIICSWASLIVFSCWLLIQFLSIIFFAQSPGQFLAGLKYTTVRGMKTSKRERLLRAAMFVVNIGSLGIRPLFLFRKKDGFTCNVSKTKITYASFVDD